MAVGKTSFSKKLSNKMKLSFIDLDREIEKRENCKIPYIFENKGENYFREIETKYLYEIINENDDFILSCGGGTACFNNNINIMNDNGITICINLPVATIIQRLSNAKTERPLLKNIDKKNIYNIISSLLTEREEYYKKAKITINGLNYNLPEIINNINKNK